MRHRASGVAGKTSFTAFCAILLALMLLFVTGVDAQETTAGQTVAQSEGTTATATKVQETTAQAGDATAGTVTKDEDTVVAEDTSSEDPEQDVQEGGQQTQTGGDDDDGSQAATRAATPNAQPARITESTSDTDNIVDRIVVPIEDCEVEDDAVLVVEDDDGTRVTLTNGQNVTVTSDDSRLIVEGTDAGGNLTDLDQNGGNQQFGTVDETVVGEVVSSTGIVCGRDDDDDGNGGTGANVSDGCTTLAVLEGDKQDRETLAIPEDSNRLRAVYATLSPDGTLGIGALNTSVEQAESAIDEMVSGTESGVVTGRVLAGNTYTVTVVPTDQIYRVTFEALGGDDECTKPGDQGDVLTESIPDDGELPDTGGVSVSALAGCVALLMVGTALIGAAVRRGR